MSTRYELTDKQPCLACNQPCHVALMKDSKGDWLHFNCKECGDFVVPFSLPSEIHQDKSGTKYRLFIKKLESLNISASSKDGLSRLVITDLD